MGKCIIVPNVSYTQENIGKISGVNANVSNGRAIIIHTLSYASKNLGQVTFIGNEHGDELKITALENVTLSFSNNLEYKYDSHLWDEWSEYEANTNLSIGANKTIMFRGSLSPTENIGIGTFSVSGRFVVSGNILSITNIYNTSLTISNYEFKYLFKDCEYLVDASELILPRTTSVSCYEGMFKNCYSLQAAPVLPATTLLNNCYKELFYNCESLDYIKINAITPLGEDYSLNWVYNVASTGTFKQSLDANNENGVNSIPEGWDSSINYSELYFTIESLEDNNTITASKNNSSINPQIYYSLNNGETWNNTLLSGGTVTFGTINTNERIIFKSTVNQWGNSWNAYNSFNATKQFKVFGNGMSLLYGDDFVNNSEFDIESSNNFSGLFKDVTTIIDASNLCLPALYATASCYNGMFRGCSNLVYGPKELPAISLKQDSYSSMFEGCVSLVEAPKINAVSFDGSNSMQRMFCMSRTEVVNAALTKGPVLLALTLASTSYKEMFKGNGSLIEITCLAKSGLDQCTDWLLNCSSTGTFYKNADATWSIGTSGIPNDWTIENYIEN